MNRNHPAIKDLKMICHDENDKTYYATNNMMKEGIFLEEFIQFGENHEVFTYITLKAISKDNAELFSVYEGVVLTDIQIYRILKDVLDLFGDYHTVDFLNILRELSSSYMSSSMQSYSENRLNIRQEMQKELKFVKEGFKI